MLEVVLAVGLGLVIFWVGLFFLRTLGRPMPEPPPPGEMRRVNLRYRCSLCGAEVKMVLASEQLPEPPRHCQEDMDLVTPIDDLE